MQEEQSQLAVNANKLRRLRSEETLALHPDLDDASRVVAVPPQVPCMDHLADKHFAIAASQVEKARAECQGNWIELGHQAFRDKFGGFVEVTDQSAMILEHHEDDAEADVKGCQALLGPGLCRLQLQVEPVAEKYNAYHREVLELLRQARDVRRRDGYVPYHPLLLFCNAQDTGVIKYVFLLARVSFNPFDATLIEFVLEGETRATLKIANGAAVLHRLPLLLYKLAQLDDDLLPKTGTYSVMSLKEISIDGSRLCSCIADGGSRELVTEEPAKNNDNDTQLDPRHTWQAVMKALQGSKSATKTSNKRKGNQDQQRKGNGNEKALMNRKKKTNVNPVQPVEDSEGVSDKIDQTTMVEWGTALETQLGPIPLTPVSQPTSSSSSSTRQNPNPDRSTGPPPIPIVSRTVPWRDERGYCWTYNPSSGKAYPLGQVLI
eukprot:Skav234338  [mRNA]  locus=scaffold306:500809:502110:+ [translate_table: standard]